MNSTETKQYLTFKLAAECYAFEIDNVREVLDFTTITRMPRMPAFLRGMINLRGDIVPVVDLRMKFGLPLAESTICMCIIIMEIFIDSEKTLVGALADSVLEVIELESQQIEPPPKIGIRLKNDFIKGIGKRENNFILILDVDHVFSNEELLSVKEIQEDRVEHANQSLDR